MPTTTWKNAAFAPEFPSVEWQEAKAYTFHIRIVKDDPDSYSAIVLNLPGIGSCGSTEEQAMENAKGAIRGALEAYETSNEPIPWKENTRSMDVPPGAKDKWIVLDA